MITVVTAIVCASLTIWTSVRPVLARTAISASYRHRKRPTAPALIRVAASKVRKTTNLFSTGSFGSRGGRLITSGSFASKASGRARVTAATRLIQSSWVGNIGSSRSFITWPSMVFSTSGKNPTA